MNRAAHARWTPLLADYAVFHAMEIRTGDVDPVYRVLRRLSPFYSNREMALLSFLHVAYYDLGSALRAYGHLGGKVDFGAIDTIMGFPCGTERRGMRDRNEMRKHLHALFTIDAEFAGLHRWAAQFPTYGELFGALQGIYGNGRWAAYKTSELLSWSMRDYLEGAHLWEPTDMGHAHSSGPRQGLELLWAGLPLPAGHGAQAVRRLDAVSEALVVELHREGIWASQATAETTLCDFHSLVKGRYYPGHDINQMGEQLDRAWRLVKDGPLLGARSHVAQAIVASVDEFEGEAVKPVDKARRKTYQATGKIT